MSQIRFDQINTNDNNDSNFKVGFFSLKNDGDEAIVRIMHDSIDSFDIVTTHPIQVGNKYRRVNCIRDPRDPLDNCPLCKAGSKIQQRLYIHLIQYVKDDQGNIIPQGKVWERAASYAVTIKNLIDEYGPLSNCIFKIRRNGEAGSMQTTYSILYGNPQVYRDEFYPRDNSIFEGYTAVGSAVMNKSFDEISEFMATGEFPQTNRSTTAANPVPQADIPFTYTEPSQVPDDFVRNNMINPNMNISTTSIPQNPTRYYNTNVTPQVTNQPFNASTTSGVYAPQSPQRRSTDESDQPAQRPVRYY